MGVRTHGIFRGTNAVLLRRVIAVKLKHHMVLTYTSYGIVASRSPQLSSKPVKHVAATVSRCVFREPLWRRVTIQKSGPFEQKPKVACNSFAVDCVDLYIS